MIGNDENDSLFTGVIQEEGGGIGTGGGVKKVGASNCTLAGASTYKGDTMIEGGALLANNLTGSATGTGAVTVNAGTLGGIGILSGSVTVGTGSGTGASVSPGENGELTIGTLTLQGTVTFNQDASYQCEINSDAGAADQVLAKGVTLSGANIVFTDLGHTTLATGTALTILSNSAATPIVGEFANLADGETVTIGSNTFQASYEGGDGNDLTLTVVP
jgi:autotransporter-associated beta strand protein